MTVAVALCFLLREESGHSCVLLGRKKTGFGVGKIVGVGGKLEAGESDGDAACREMQEETGVCVRPGDLERAGRIFFDFPARPAWNMDAALFVARRWSGVPLESAEIAPSWHRVDRLPLGLMWQDAGHWLPLALSGDQPRLRVVMRPDNQTVADVENLDTGHRVAWQF
ncbi:8-oxo-dGTP diphosphatase [Arthrobacter sulfonylureivorans]|uniref:Oxidized purine nucleoside triphosphate hydrolase n=1 Tax=Arthrobacter sulfonylureivorans TaxID=2486855 RepID=A0ABY3W6M4_9MICC|nr:NUDIX domain-containing protein [Arthrobacter sulfonylureivorans]UNK44733.1 NUDIX domain-containing protein [Arthrobacter sulfonylureivorans]